MTAITSNRKQDCISYKVNSGTAITSNRKQYFILFKDALKNTTSLSNVFTGTMPLDKAVRICSRFKNHTFLSLDSYDHKVATYKAEKAIASA